MVLWMGFWPLAGMASIWKPVMVSVLVLQVMVMVVSVASVTRALRGGLTSASEGKSVSILQGLWVWPVKCLWRPLLELCIEPCVWHRVWSVSGPPHPAQNSWGGSPTYFQEWSPPPGLVGWSESPSVHTHSLHTWLPPRTEEVTPRYDKDLTGRNALVFGRAPFLGDQLLRYETLKSISEGLMGWFWLPPVIRDMDPDKQ